MANDEKPGMRELDIEGYGGDDINPGSIASSGQGAGMRSKDAYGDRSDGGMTGGTDFGTGAAEAAGRGGDTDTRQEAYNAGFEDTTANASKAEMFGEWEDTGVGTDLTEEMEYTDAKSGLVKGGETGASDAAGPGQYGGATGGVGDKG